jgi:hypothetical protein
MLVGLIRACTVYIVNALYRFLGAGCRSIVLRLCGSGRNVQDKAKNCEGDSE